LPDRGPAAERFPLDAIEAVKQSIREMVKEAGVRVGLVSAAAGADLLFIDALQERKKPVHIVLPWAMEEFRKTSVAPYEPASAPPVWGPMFKAAIAQAATVREIGQSYEPSSSVGWEYMMEVTAGIALHSARASRLDILPMALWDGKPGRGAGGTESFVQFWQGQLRYTPMIIPMPEQPGGRSAYVLRDRPTRSEHSTLKQSVKSMLFADIYGYSKLTEHVIPEFVENFLTRVSELAASSSYAPRLVNTWGDAIYAVFDFAHQAGCFALELTQMIKEGEKEWLAKGLYFEEWVEGQAEPKKQPLSIRVGLHTGPVFMHYDPLVRELGFTGTHVSRAARIEPVAKPGEVYASEEFAALAELGAEIRRQARNGAAPERLDFVCEYAGSLALAKGYPGRFRIYRVIPKRILALDELAEAVHESYCLEARRRGEMTDNNRALRPWQELPDDLKAANRAQVADIPNKLQLLGYELAPSSGLSPSEIVLTDVQVEELSIREHDRWMKDRQLHGWTYAPERDNARKKHPCLIPWEELSDLEKEKDRDTIRNLPRLIEKAGFRVRKSTTQPSS
jgi:class 3 adenylate cyclase